ncbi:Hypothetical protein PSEBR_m1699 [Pseudomonas brassicacearum subsp. brassicacearum NFM421]|uniref:Uncharacterized protein n=1 Tax=Pseudomonas brassicacearum (strain NFM421) TaxID=994484 RepID=F2K6K0_PSEBN|nr:Hypothetical protein PSEBR_m1699 [Pseudomonas brassicacearum subsp. brassicacearum NFM421]
MISDNEQLVWNASRSRHARAVVNRNRRRRRRANTARHQEFAGLVNPRRIIVQ